MVVLSPPCSVLLNTTVLSVGNGDDDGVDDGEGEAVGDCVAEGVAEVTS